MSIRALQTLKHALDAFVNQDPAAARALIPQDKPIDLLNKRIHGQLADQMIAAPDTILRCLNMMASPRASSASQIKARTSPRMWFTCAKPWTSGTRAAKKRTRDRLATLPRRNLFVTISPLS